MKTINLRGITESLSESEMKKVKGGADGGASGLDEYDHNCPTPESCGPDGAAGGSGGDGLCAYSATVTSPDVCVPDADTAERLAGRDGWWCCNCLEAIFKCGTPPFDKYF